MGVLASILGGGKVIEEGFKLIDSMHTSEVESIEAKTKAKTDLLTAYAPFKIAQRYIALLFTVNFLFCFQLVLWMTLLGKGDVDEVLKIMAAFQISWIMLLIVGFYYGGGAFEGVTKAVRKK